MSMTTRMFDLKDCKTLVQFGNKSKRYATKIGKFKDIAVSKSGEKTPILLNDVKFTPYLHYNLLSLSKEMKVFKQSRKDDQLKLILKSPEYCFDHKIKSGLGFLFGLKVMTGKGDTFVPYKKGHMFLTHANKVTTMETMKKLNYSLGAVPNKPCKYCAISKEKQKKVCKMTPSLDLWKGKGWFIDLSNMKWAAMERKKF